VIAKPPVVIIPGDPPEEGICSYGGKDFEKRKVLKPIMENATKKVNKRSRIRDYDDGEELSDDEVSN